MLAKATKPKQQFYQTQEFQTFTTVVAVGAAFFTGGASLVALAAMNAGTGALTGLAQGGIQGALVGAIGGAANAYVSSYTGGAVNVGLSYTKEGGFGASVSGGVKGVASVGISASQHGGVSVNAGIEINPAIKASISASKDGVQTNLDVGKISVGVNYSKDGGFGGSIGYKGDNFTAGLNIGPGGKTSALLGATTTDGKYSGGLEIKSTGDVSGYVAAGKQKLTYNKNDGFGVNITAGALNIVASQHGDTVVNATVGTGKFSLNTSKGTMSSRIDSGSNGITAGENLVTSLDDLMSKTDSMAEANRQKAMDEARKADLDKIKNDKSDPRYNPDYATMSEEDIRKDIKTRSESGDLVRENVEGIARGESRGDGFLENTLGDMKDDLMGAIGVTADKNGFTDASGNYHQRTCFTNGTLVETLNGAKAMEQLKIGELALTRNEKTGKMEYKPITQLFENKVELLFDVEVGNTTLQTTWNHPFWVVTGSTGSPTGKWTEVKDLKLGDIVSLKDGSEAPITKIRQYNVAPTKVYNIEVEDNHNYFVGDNGVWVHNYPLTGVNIGFGQSIVEFGKKAVGVVNSLLSRESSEEQLHYSKEKAVKLTPEIEKKVTEIADKYYEKTGKSIHLTSGKRDSESQANELMQAVLQVNTKTKMLPKR